MLNPIIWDGNNQISGDEIILKENNENNKLDSLIVTNNGFIVKKIPFELIITTKLKELGYWASFLKVKLKV